MQQLLQFISNHWLLMLIWLLLCIVTITFMVRSSLSAVREIDNHQAIQLINQEKAELWDVRPQPLFTQGHIAQAQHVAIEVIKTKQVASLTRDKGKPIILVSEDGVQALTSAKLLYQQGFQQVLVLRDGIIGWNRDQLPLTVQGAKQRPAPVEIYTRTGCPYCTRAKALLAQRGAVIREISIDQDDNKKQEMVKRSGRTTVPQIFIRGQHIGGCDDLLDLDNKQQLAALLH